MTEMGKPFSLKDILAKKEERERALNTQETVPDTAETTVAKTNAWLDQNRGSMPPDVYNFIKTKLETKPTNSPELSETNETKPPAQPPVPTEVVTKETETADPYLKDKESLIDELITSGIIDKNDRDYRLKQITKEKAKDTGGILDLADNNVFRLDPEGNSKFSNPDLWNRIKKLALDAYGIELIYPAAGTISDMKLCEISEVVRGTRSAERSVVSVSGIGYKKGGVVVRRARVRIAS